jgi:transposase
MDVMCTHGAGLDVHKKTVMAYRVTPDPTGEQADGVMEPKEFGAMTADLLALADWLAAAGITHVAIESTGEDWKPLYNILEGDFTVFLVNSAHVKQVPGRKTDKADARWLAKLMRDHEEVKAAQRESRAGLTICRRREPQARQVGPMTAGGVARQKLPEE